MLYASFTMKRQNKVHQINIRLTEEDIEKLDLIQEHTGSTRSEVLRKWLKLGIEHDIRSMDQYFKSRAAAEKRPAARKAVKARRK